MPGAANRETSGRSRVPSLGTPGPLCHIGFWYPPPQVENRSFVEVMQLLAPPLPPTGARNPGQYLLNVSLHCCSAVVSPVKVKSSLFVQVSFHVDSGTYPLAEASVTGSLVEFQYVD